jgi:hypothetical protein
MKRLAFSAVIAICLPAFLFAGKDPADYPLKVHILQQSWSSHNVRFSEYRATGRGNIWEGDSVHGFDFTYDCSFGLTRTARNQPYLAKWKKASLRLAVLAGQIGKNEKYHECELKTTIRDGVYIATGNGLNEMSQGDYKAWKARQTAASASSVVSRLAVASSPDSAEIEIDGEFVGNTPSVLDLAPGEHSVMVHKTGYKAYEKKIMLTAGEIKIHAELEQESAK